MHMRLCKAASLWSYLLSEKKGGRFLTICGTHDVTQSPARVRRKDDGAVYSDPDSLPSLEDAYAAFLAKNPRYADTAVLDALRSAEYAHLGGRVCLDYCGFGLFSCDSEQPSFALAEVTASLCAHAMFGAAAEGTAECDVRKRIMDYLKVSESDYSMVFTPSRGATFKLLADAYPFRTSRRLVTMYDYESESVGWMLRRASEKGAKISNASFKWPSLRVSSSSLKKQLTKDPAPPNPKRKKGLFVFPVQSRVSGSKYSYQWMSLAQRNHWHVLLDASALAPKDMSSLGLSLFRPDFIIASFYKVFGADPSGFGCLFIKNSVIKTIQDPSGLPSPGIARIIPVSKELSYDGDSVASSELDGDHALLSVEEELHNNSNNNDDDDNGCVPVSSFSGPMLSFKPNATPNGSKNPAYSIEGIIEEECESDFVSHSPVFSEDDGTENLSCLDMGPSPSGALSHYSMSEEGFSGPYLFSGDLASSTLSHDLRGKRIASLSDANGGIFTKNSTGEALELQREKTYNDAGETSGGSIHEIVEEGSNNALKESSRFSEEAEGSGADLGDKTIRRESEGKFRLLGQRNDASLQITRKLSKEKGEGGRGEGSLDDSLFDMFPKDSVEFETERDESGSEKEPEIFCRGLDHADMVGLNKSNQRQRCLINWLVSSVQQLWHVGPEKEKEKEVPLVHVYGPQIRPDRGASIAFNLFDCNGRLIHPEQVLMLADQNGISISVGFLHNLQFSEDHVDLQYFDKEENNTKVGGKPTKGKKKPLSRIEVVTAALSLLSNFEDVYKIWVFIAKFLDAEFVSREAGHLQAPNSDTVSLASNLVSLDAK